MRIVVFDGPLFTSGDVSWAALERLGGVRVVGTAGKEDIPIRAADAEAVFTLCTPLNREAIRAMPALRYIGVIDAFGLPRVNVAAAHKRGIAVCRVAVDAATPLAEHAFALMMELAREVGRHAHAVARGRWRKEGRAGWWLSPLRRLAGRTVGLVGWAPLGPAVAARAAAFGMPMLAHSPDGAPVSHPGVERVSLDVLLARSDVVLVHLADGAGPVLDADRLTRMKPGSWLIQTGPYAAVDEAALVAALVGGAPAAAALDGLAIEPPPPDHPLLGRPNCLITPRHGWAALETRQEFIEAAAANLEAFLAGRPVNVLAPAAGDHG